MDGNFRMLPKGGGYLEQDYDLMQEFRIIENRIRMKQARRQTTGKPAGVQEVAVTVPRRR